MNRGTEEENRGDEALVKVAHKFWWFPHMWDHSQPHLYRNSSKLEKLMLLNRNFAQVCSSAIVCTLTFFQILAEVGVVYALSLEPVMVTH